MARGEGGKRMMQERGRDLRKYRCSIRLLDPELLLLGSSDSVVRRE